MRESIKNNGDKIAVWTFDKFKTKKGCDSYFDTCSKENYSKNTLNAQNKMKIETINTLFRRTIAHSF